MERGDGTEHAASLHAVLGRDDLHRRVHGGGEEEERLEQSGGRAHGWVGLDRGDDGGGDLDHGLERYVHPRGGRQREGARAQEGLVLRRLLRSDLPHATIAVLPRRHQVPVENLGVLPEAEVKTQRRHPVREALTLTERKRAYRQLAEREESGGVEQDLAHVDVVVRGGEEEEERRSGEIDEGETEHRCVVDIWVGGGGADDFPPRRARAALEDDDGPLVRRHEQQAVRITDGRAVNALDKLANLKGLSFLPRSLQNKHDRLAYITPHPVHNMTVAATRNQLRLSPRQRRHVALFQVRDPADAIHVCTVSHQKLFNGVRLLPHVVPFATHFRIHDNNILSGSVSNERIFGVVPIALLDHPCPNWLETMKLSCFSLQPRAMKDGSMAIFCPRVVA